MVQKLGPSKCVSPFVSLEKWVGSWHMNGGRCRATALQGGRYLPSQNALRFCSRV